MKVSINVNPDRLGLEGVLTPKIALAVQTSVNQALSETQDRFQQLARSRLHSTLPHYLKSLHIDNYIDQDGFHGVMSLSGVFPNMLDNGWKPFDMKKGFSQSNRAKRKKNGGWYLTIPLSKRRSIGYTPINLVTQSTSNVLSLHNKHNAGLSRVINSYNSRQQPVTFRRVSDKSPSTSWINKGYNGVHIMKELQMFSAESFYNNLIRNLHKV